MKINYKHELFRYLEALKMVEILAWRQNTKVEFLKKAITLVRKNLEEKLKQ